MKHSDPKVLLVESRLNVYFLLASLSDTLGLRLAVDVRAGLKIACRLITYTQNTQYLAP